MMTTISDKDRAEAQAMAEAFHDGTLAALHDEIVRRWLAVRDRMFATHECPAVPVWRPTTRDEIQPGWEVRSRRRNGSEAGWGVAHHRDDDGDWRTEARALLTLTNTDLGLTYETTAPLPEPEPWDEALVGVVSDALAGEDPGPHWDDDARRVLDALAARGYLDRAAITGGRPAVSNLREILGDRYEAAIKAASHAMSRHWRAMHTNEALGLQRMLAAHALAAVLPDLLADVWDEGHADGLHNAHEHREHRKMRNPYRPETITRDATDAPVTLAAPDAINPPPDPSAAVTGPHSPERTTR